MFLFFHYYLIYFGYLNSIIVLVLTQLLNRQFDDFFVEFLILNVLCIYQYSYYKGVLLTLFYLSILLTIFHQILSISFSFFCLRLFLNNLLYYHLLMIYYLL